MSFKTMDHDVTCLCALVNLPKRVIVEELPPERGLARFQLQAFTEGAVGALLEWLGPVATGAKVRRRQGEFAFGRIEVEEGDAAVMVRDMVRFLEERGEGGLTVSAALREVEARFEVRLRALVRVMERAQAAVALACAETTESGR